MSGRRNFFLNNPGAVGFAISAEPGNVDPEAHVLASVTPTLLKAKTKKPKDGRNEVIIVGAGVGGLTTAIEILKANANLPDQNKWKVTILEAHDRTGGRCRSVRTGDNIEEAATDSITDNTVASSQLVHWDYPTGDSKPYLNAGPGRICSSHKNLLSYLKQFKVPLEVYVMNSAANVTLTDLPTEEGPLPNRRYVHDTRGLIAQEIARDLRKRLAQFKADHADFQTRQEFQELDSKLELMVTFGGLVPANPSDPNSPWIYRPEASKPGTDDTSSDRAGYKILPQVTPGVVETGLEWKDLLKSKFWNYRVYQSDDFLWQPTLLQPVGGMDKVEKSFAREVRTLGGKIILNHPVTKISRANGRYVVEANGKQFYGHYVFSNAAIPFLHNILDKGIGLDKQFADAIEAVYQTQINPKKDTHGTPLTFLAHTCKVGWQGDREMWQTNPAPGGVPIFGGISYTKHEITQVWYPSSGFHDQKGILTGCYNYEKDAIDLGNKTPEKRLEIAREGAAQLNLDPNRLENGVSIAWHKVPYIHGGWTSWQNVENGVDHFNHLINGSKATGDSAPSFFIVGDQLSSLPGWQEGAIASALNATSILLQQRRVGRVLCLPDTRLTVQGV